MGVTSASFLLYKWIAVWSLITLKNPKTHKVTILGQGLVVCKFSKQILGLQNFNFLQQQIKW